MSPKEIIEFVLHKEKLTYYALAKAMGLGRAQVLYDIRNGKVKAISGNFARKILEAFPNSGYTLAFLLTGDEKLLETPNCEDTESQESTNMIGDRIKKIISEKNCSINSFAAMIGVRQNTLSQQLTGGRKVSLEIVQKIALSFDDINIHWLLTGEGSMLKSEAQSNTSLSPPQTEGSLSDREELKEKDEKIRILENHIDFMENVIKTKEGCIVNRDFTIHELTKKIEVLTKEVQDMKEQLSKQGKISKKEKSA